MSRHPDASITRRLEWLDQVLADPDVGPQSFQVAYVLVTRFLNAASGRAWPTIATLGREVNRSSRRAQEAVTELVTRGHLTHQRGGKGRPSVYEIAFHDRTKTSAQSDDRQDENVPSMETMTGQERPINDDKIGRFPRVDRTKVSKIVGRKRPTNPLKEPFEEPFERRAHKKTRSAHATRLPENWTLPDSWATWALENGLPRDRLESTETRFRNYWLSTSGRHAAKLDWQRTWQNWILSDLDRIETNSKGRNKQSSFIADLNASLRDEHDGPTIEGEALP